MTSAEVNTTYSLRPTLTDLDVELLRSILAQEESYFQQFCSAVDGSWRPLEPTEEEGNSLHVKITASLLRHGKDIEQIHNFFQKLTPRRYPMKLATQMEVRLQVVDRNYRVPYTGTETKEVMNKESGSQLHPQFVSQTLFIPNVEERPCNLVGQESEIYECVLLAAQHPELASSDDSSDITSDWVDRHSDPSDVSDSSLSPASKECMWYDRSKIRRSSIFEIDAEDLVELARQAFCLTHRRHEYYLREVKKLVMGDPAQVLVREMRDLQLIHDSECHPYYKPDLFRRKEDYNKWLNLEKDALATIIRNQEKKIKGNLPAYPNGIPLINKDKHTWYKILLVKLFRAESVNCRINFGTREAIPKEPLSPTALRLLDEFGERYRIGFLFRRVCILEYLARNFDSECKQWYFRYVLCVFQSILSYARRDELIVRKDEIEIVKKAVTWLHEQVKHILTRINRVFPNNSPQGLLHEVIGLLSFLVTVDEDRTFGERNGKTVGQYLKMYAEEEMRTNYERQKIIIADQLKLRSFSRQLTPSLISRMIYDIDEKLRNYRMHFKQEFIEYFDIVEVAMEVFYDLLMDDVLELCDIYPVNQQQETIDYLMIALAYRLTTFDHDSAWENYLIFERQIWRPSFLKHSLAWISSLHGKLHHLISEALEHDTWQGLQIDHMSSSMTSMDSQMLHQSEQRTRPRAIRSPLSNSPSDVRPSSSGVTPSRNSAFVPVNSRSASVVQKEFSSDVSQERPRASSTTSYCTADQPSCSNVKEASKEPSDVGSHVKIPGNSSASNLLKYVQNTKVLGSSVTSQSTESIYTDAKSDVDDYTSCDGGETDQLPETSHQDYTTIPVSSSLIDVVCGINRLINIVRHFSQLLYPKMVKKSTTRHNSLRMSPDDRTDIYDRLEQGRVNMARKVGDMIQSLIVFYGDYVISCERCGMSDDVLEPIIGQRCVTRSRSLMQENNIRPCRHRTAGLERCNTADSHGNYTTSCLAMSQIENNAAQSERVVKEMCVRLNNVRTIKILLSRLVETAVGNVLAPGSGTDFNSFAVFDVSNLTISEEESKKPSTSASSAVPNDIVDKTSIKRTVDELQEIEDGLVSLMAHRANAAIKNLLRLLLTLNLRSFNSRKRLQPVLNATRKTVHTLAVNLYPDCYAAVLRQFWLAIVKDFEEQKENLVFLNGTAKEQANLLWEGISYFIEIFRSEEDSVPLAFVSTTIEPVLQSLNYYILPTRNLIQMYEALQQRNTSVVRTSDSVSGRHRYQRMPSNRFIRDLHIQLHSEHAQYFSGRQFVESVADRIRFEGNLGLGICAVPNGCDSDSGKALGQYLLDNDILCYVGKPVEKAADHDSDDDDDLEEEIKRYSGLGGQVIFPTKGKHKTFNNYMFSSSDTRSSINVESSGSGNTIIIQEDAIKPSRFIDSEKVLYKFKMPELEESLSDCHPEYFSDQADNGSEVGITTVLFTRRNIEQEAKQFLNSLGRNAVLDELQNRITNNSKPNCCWPSGPLLIVDS